MKKLLPFLEFAFAVFVVLAIPLALGFGIGIGIVAGFTWASNTILGAN